MNFVALVKKVNMFRNKKTSLNLVQNALENI